MLRRVKNNLYFLWSHKISTIFSLSNNIAEKLPGKYKEHLHRAENRLFTIVPIIDYLGFSIEK